MAADSQPIVQLSHVELRFGTSIIHHDISFSIRSGEGVVILGPSGTGKTLILKMIAGLIRPTGGEVFVFGQSMGALSEERLVKLRADIGMVFQGAALFDSLTVYENIAYSLREAGEKSEARIAETVKTQLGLVNLSGTEEKYPQELSGGQKKRIGLARALARAPKVVLFDEPTTGLDPTATRLIDELILKLRVEHGITTVSVTHDIASARRIADRWILIDSGRVLADGRVDEVSQHQAPVMQFISGTWRD